MGEYKRIIMEQGEGDNNQHPPIIVYNEAQHKEQMRFPRLAAFADGFMESLGASVMGFVFSIVIVVTVLIIVFTMMKH